MGNECWDAPPREHDDPDPYELALASARELGAADGTGSDHECDLSGQWADRPGGPEVFARILAEAGVTEPSGEEWFTELLDVYEEAYNEA